MAPPHFNLLQVAQRVLREDCRFHLIGDSQSASNGAEWRIPSGIAAAWSVPWVGRMSSPFSGNSQGVPVSNFAPSGSTRINRNLQTGQIQSQAETDVPAADYAGLYAGPYSDWKFTGDITDLTTLFEAFLDATMNGGVPYASGDWVSQQRFTARAIYIQDETCPNSLDLMCGNHVAGVPNNLLSLGFTTDPGAGTAALQRSSDVLAGVAPSGPGYARIRVPAAQNESGSYYAQLGILLYLAGMTGFQLSGTAWGGATTAEHSGTTRYTQAAAQALINHLRSLNTFMIMLGHNRSANETNLTQINANYKNNLRAVADKWYNAAVAHGVTSPMIFLVSPWKLADSGTLYDEQEAMAERMYELAQEDSRYSYFNLWRMGPAFAAGYLGDGVHTDTAAGIMAYMAPIWNAFLDVLGLRAKGSKFFMLAGEE